VQGNKQLVWELSDTFWIYLSDKVSDSFYNLCCFAFSKNLPQIV
jgi:hypothetical protein